MPTTIVKTIGTGGDYSALQAWEDACPANLVTADQIWQGQCKNQEFAVPATALNISGITTDATRYIELTTEAGASFLDHASKSTNPLRYDATKGASIRATNAYGWPIRVQVPFTKISNLQVKNHPSSANNALTCTANGSIVSRCIIEGDATPLGFGDINTLVNSVVIKRAGGGNIVNAAYGLDAYNCTLVMPSDLTPAVNGINGAYGGKTANLKNVAIFGATTAVNLAATKVITTCATDQAAPLAGFSTVPYANCFENTANAASDFRLKSGASLIDAGTTDGTYGTSDIVNTTRTSFDIGAWEFSAGGGATITTNLGTATAAGLTASIFAAVTIACSVGVAVASGNQASISTGSNVTISASLGTAAASGNTASVVSAGSATITTDVFKNNTGTVLASTVIPKLAAIKLSDMTLAASWTSQATNGSGILSLTGTMTAATEYLLVVSSADGAAVGVKKYTAT